MENEPNDRQGKTIAESEEQIMLDLKKEFLLIDQAFRKTYELFSEILGSDSYVGEDAAISRRVCNQIFMKIYDDLRCVYLLGFRGYPNQTASIVASLYESVFMLLYVADNDEIAAKWILHRDHNRNFSSIKEMTLLGLKNIMTDEVEVTADAEYALYQQLCMAKHGNPLLQMTQGREVIVDEVFLRFGPKNTKIAQHMTWFSACHAIRLSVFACSGIAKYHAPDDSLDKILNLRDLCLELVGGIAAERQKREGKA